MTGGSASGQLDLLQLRGLLACHALPFPKMKLRAQLGASQVEQFWVLYSMA